MSRFSRWRTDSGSKLLTSPFPLGYGAGSLDEQCPTFRSWVAGWAIPDVSEPGRWMSNARRFETAWWYHLRESWVIRPLKMRLSRCVTRRASLKQYCGAPRNENVTSNGPLWQPQKSQHCLLSLLSCLLRETNPRRCNTRNIALAVCVGKAICSNYDGFSLFYSRTLHLDIIKVFYLPTDAQENCFKKNIKIYIITASTYFGLITIIISERIIRAC